MAVEGIVFERIVSRPDIVDASCLQENNCIASTFERGYVKNFIFDSESNKYVSKSEYNKNHRDSIEFLKHSYLIFDGQTYAIYKGKILGRGHYSKARVAQNIETNQWIVLKVVKDDDVDGIKFVETEVEMLRHTSQFGGFLRDKNNPNKFRVIMFLAQGIDLETYINNLKRNYNVPTQSQLLKLAESIAIAVNKLHANKILHRDIKPANIVVDPQTLLATLIDFGFASFESNHHITNLQEVGTNRFMAPEIFLPDDSSPKFKRYTTKSDGYALGVTLAELFHMQVDRRPYKPHTYHKINSINSSPMFEKLIPDAAVRDELLELVRGLTRENLRHRLNPEMVSKSIRQLYENLDYSYVMDRMVGVIDVAEYADEATSDFRKAEIIRCLHEFDQVILVNDTNKKKTPLELANIQEELLKAGVLCREKVCYYDKSKISGQNVLSSIQQVLNEEDQLYYYNLCQVSNNKTTTTNLSGTVQEKTIYTSCFKSSAAYQKEIRLSYFENKVSESDLKKVRKNIRDEMERIEFKYKNNPNERKARIDCINKTLRDMSGNSQLNYGQLKGYLEKLSKDVANIKRRWYIPLIMQKKSFTARLMGDLVNKVLPPVRKKEIILDKYSKDISMYKQPLNTSLFFQQKYKYKSLPVRLVDEILNKFLVQIRRLI